jgi:predicted nuclease with TOPRIM domain
MEPNFDILDIKNQDLCCGFCSKKYSTKTNLNKHLKICKIKKENDNEKENIFKLLLEKDKENKENKERIEKLEKQNLLLMNKIDKLISIKDNLKSYKATKKPQIIQILIIQ